MAWLSLEELKKYDAKKELEKLGTKKAVAKATPSLRSQGQPVEVVRDTGLKSSLKTTMEKRREAAKTPGVKINTDRGFTVQNTTINPRIGWKPADMTKSTAKDEKTRLYETNDSLLNPQEILKKYSYVAQDRDMDYATLRRAVNKGMREVGRTLRGTNDNSQYERVAKLQTELQGRLKSASFTAGLLESMGGDGKDALVKLSGNEALQKQNEALKAQMEATKANHSSAATAGQITGEFAKAGAGYMTIGKAGESLILKGVGKLGQRMAAATAADGAQKLAAKVLFDPKQAKAAGFAARMLAQQAADTLVNTPITIINGAAEGKSRKELLQDFAKQEATDAAFNLGLAGLGAGAKALGKAKQAKAEQRAAKAAAKAAEQTETAAKAMAEPAEAAEQAIKEAAAETGDIRQETIQGAAAGMAENRNVLAKRMSREEIKALETEHANLQSAEYKAAKLQEVSDATGGDPAAIRNAQKALEDRKLEIEKTLTQQEAMRTSAGIIKDVSDEVMGIFNLKGKKRKQKVQDALRRLITEAEEGKISEEQRNSLFEKLFQISGESKTGVYGLKKRLREKKLILSVEGAADIPDINGWNNALRGKMGRVKVARDSNISAFYHELRKDFPAYFPEGIDREADQLRQMRKIAEKLKGEIGLEKSDYQENFNSALDRLIDALDVHKAYAAEVGKKAEGFRSNLLGKIDYGKVTPEEVQAWHNERYRLQKKLDEQGQAYLSDMEQDVLKNMLDGKVSEKEAKKYLGSRYALIKQKYNIQKPLHDVDEKIIGYKRFLSAKKQEGIAETVGEIHLRQGAEEGWKDKNIPLLYERETQERNLYDIAPNKEVARRIIDNIIAPIHENERKRVLMINDAAKELEKLKIDTRETLRIELPNVGKKKISESALVQWLGENRYELERMKAAGATEESYGELERAIQKIERGLQPKQLERINKAIVTLQGNYKMMHEMLNKALIRNGFDPIGYIDGYFPHMNFDDPTDPLRRAGQALGFDFSAKELPMDIAGRTETFRPRKRWSGNLLERKGTETDYDAMRAFDLYVDNISDIIYHTEDISKVRSMAEYFRYSLSDEGIKAQIDELRKRRDIPIEDINEKIAKLYKENSQNHKMQNFVNNLELYADLLAGKKHRIDRAMETSVAGRKFYNAINTITNKISGNMVAGNIGSALTNFIPATQSMARMSPTSNLRGLKESLINLCTKDMDELTRKSAFLATRGGTERLYKNTMQRISEAGGKLNPLQWMEVADEFTTQAVWRSRYYDNLKKGFSIEDSIKEADEFARGLFAGRSKGAMPTIFYAKDPRFKALTMFQLEVNNQVSHIIKDIPREEQGNVIGMFRAYMGLVIGAYIYNDFYEKATGRRSALDPLGIAREAIGDATGETLRNTLDIIGDLVEGDGLQLTEKTEKKKGAEVYSGLKENIAENIPFIGGLMGGGRIPISSAFPDFDAIGEAKANYATGDITKERKNQIVRKEFGKSLAYMAMPVAGGQTKKTVEGLNMMRKGGNFTQTNKGERLQFAVDQDKKTNWVQAALFGKWAIPEGQAHMEKKRTLSEKNTETYKKLVEDGAKNIRAFETLSRMQMEEKDKEKRRVIRSSVLSEEQKAILYHSITDEDSADRRILDHYQGTAHMGKAADCLMRMADYEDNKPKKYILQNTNLPDAEKKYIYLEKIVQKDDREKETKRVDALLGVGIGMNDYIDIKNKYAQINASKSKTMPDDMSRWLREKGFTWQQQAVIKEQFIFWGMHPKKYKN